MRSILPLFIASMVFPEALASRSIVVLTVDAYLSAGHIPNAELTIYPDANHGFLFQYPHEFAAAVNTCLAA